MASFRTSNAVEDIKDVIRYLRRQGYVVSDLMIEAAARLTKRGPLIRHAYPAEDPQRSSTSAAVFVHFDSEGIVFDYVLLQLKQLVEAGFRITFVSNSPLFPEASRQRVAPYCRTIIWRFNTGYDFGAYKDGIASLPDAERIDRLVLMNDSVYGPFWSLSGILAKIDRGTTDYWGIAETWEGGHHHQTFFLLFLSSALKSTAFRSFWRKFPYVDNKRWVIRNGEMRLGSVLARDGLRSQVLVPYWPVAKIAQERMRQRDLKTLSGNARTFFDHIAFVLSRGRPINPMHYFWDIVITDYGCPFIKRELIQSNPAKIPNVDKWPDVIRSVSDYDISLIDDHQRALRERRD